MIIGLIFSQLSGNKKTFNALKPIDRVSQLDQRRKQKGFKKEWLFYRCKEEGLINEYQEYIKPGLNRLNKNNFEQDNRVKFTFGKYKGKPVEEVWKTDRKYAHWVLHQDWIDEHPIIMSELEHCHHNL